MAKIIIFVKTKYLSVKKLQNKLTSGLNRGDVQLKRTFQYMRNILIYTV